MRAILTFQGNAQANFSDTGLERLFFDVIRRHASEHVTTYHPRTWKTNVAALAGQLQRHQIRHLLIVAYSHGQAATMDLARIADRHQIRSIQVLLCDPVYRNPLLPRWAWLQVLSARSLTSLARIKIPPAIQRVDWCRQYLNRPRAHELVAVDPSKTHIAEPLVIEATHSQIQRSPLFFAQADRIIYEWVHPPRAKPVQPNPA